MTTVARAERNELCDLFAEVGPDAPTLCGEWRTRQLAAHLVVRERSLLGGTGIVVGALSKFHDQGIARESTREWDDLVERVRSGPLWFGRPVDSLINTVEMFVHHEDVRRGDGTGGPRPGIDEVDAELWKRLGSFGKMLTRRVPKGIVVELVNPDGSIHRFRSGDRAVQVVGTPGELTLYLYGRTVAQVELEGEDDAVAELRATDFSA